MAPNKDMLDVSIKGHDDRDHIGVPNLIDMFSMATLVIRANAQMQELEDDDEQLDFQCGEA
jgi:beta-lactamase superfamily II metal-dependent hydrolase